MGATADGVELRETLAVFERRDDPCEPLTTTDIADALGCSRRTAYNRMTRLVEGGNLQTKKVGSGARVFWQPGTRPYGPTADAGGSRGARSPQRRRLEFRSAALARPFVGTASDDAFPALVGVVHLPDGTNLQFWETDEIRPKDILDSFRALPTVLEGRLLSTVGDTTRIEVHGSADSLLATFTRFGGRTTGLRFEDGTVTLVADLPLTADPAAVRRALTGSYPDMELVGRRLVVESDSFRRLVRDALTDRQWSVLKAAYHAGYFDRPRTATGDDLAASFGITRQTFNHHLRRAETVAFELLFSPPSEDAH
jgi:biotin operon repressor